ncbi:hypothetical protein RP20_CCG020539 [Aedes albopictus]|nr:hypothetical protein RP20_CCG020539 [Aedes albopictus]
MYRPGIDQRSNFERMDQPEFKERSRFKRMNRPGLTAPEMDEYRGDPAAVGPNPKRGQWAKNLSLAYPNFFGNVLVVAPGWAAIRKSCFLVILVSFIKAFS